MKNARRHIAQFCVAATTAGFVACTESSTVARRAGPTIRDSAGVQIVENDSFPAHELAWSIDSVASLTIGAQGTGDDRVENQFHSIKGAAQMQSGKIVVGDWGSKTVRIFDSNGTYMRNLVSTGDGPGELRSISRVMRVRGDSVFVYNGEAGKVVVFGPDLAYARTIIRVEFRPDSQAQILYSGVRGAFEDGSFLASTRYARAFDSQKDKPGQPWKEFAESTFFVKGRQGEGHIAEYGWLLDRRGAYSVREPGSYNVNSNDLAQSFYATHGTNLYYVDGAKYEVRVFGNDGKIRRLVRLVAAATRVTNDTRARFSDSLPRPHSPPTFPLIDALSVDFAGNIWLATNAHTPGENKRVPSRTWHVFDSTGVLQHRVADHTGLNITEIGDNYILGIQRDDDGVESVAKYRIVKR